jgi:hypothetical protein
MKHFLFGVRRLADVDSIKVTDLTRNIPVDYIECDKCGLIGKSSNFIPILLTLFKVIRDNFLFFESDFSVLGLQMDVNLGRIVTVQFEVHNTLLARSVLVSFDFFDHLGGEGLLFAALEFFQTLFVRNLLACALDLLNVRVALVSDHFDCVLD